MATRSASQRLRPLLRQLVALCDEVVVVIDSLSTDDSASIAREYTDHVFGFEHDDVFHNMQVAWFRHATGDWILSCDDDETLSPQWTRPLVDEIMGTHRATHVLAPMRWIMPPGDRAMITGRWYPNMMPRMYRNISSLAQFGRSPHDALWMAGEGMQVADLHVYHWDFVLNDRAKREKKAAFYTQMNPADSASEVYLYEDAEYETAPFDDRPVDRIARALEGTPSESRYAVGLEVLTGHRRMRAGWRYAILVEAANRTSRALTAPSRNLGDSPFSLAVHWWRQGDESDIGQSFGVSQTPMPATLDSMTARRYTILVDAPQEAGRYELQPDLLERDIAWFTQAADGATSEPFEVEVYSD